MKKFVYVPAFNPEYFKLGNPYQLMHKDHPNEACVAILKAVTPNHLEFIFINSNGMIQTFQMNIEDMDTINVRRLVADPEDEEGVEIPKEVQPKPQEARIKFEDIASPPVTEQQITPGIFVEAKHSKERFVVWSVDTDRVYLRSIDHDDNNPSWLTANDLVRDFIYVNIMSLSTEEWNRFRTYTTPNKGSPNDLLESKSKPFDTPIQQFQIKPTKTCNVDNISVGDVVVPITVIGPIVTYQVRQMIMNPMTNEIDWVIICPTDKINSNSDDIRIERNTFEAQYRLLSVDNEYGIGSIKIG